MRETLSKIRSFADLPVGTKIVRNAAFGSLRVLLIAPIPLLLTPFIIRRVGTQGLGIWAVFMAINNLTSLADFGFLGTLTRHVSEHYTRKDYLQLNRTLNSGLMMFAGISILCAGAVILGGNLIISAFFQHAPLSWSQMQHAVRWLGLAVGFNLLVFPFSSITAGLQRLDFTSGLAALNFIITALLAAAFLASGSGIMGLAYAIVLSALLNLVLNVGVSKFLLPEFKPSLGLIRSADIKALFSFSLQMYLTQIAVAVSTHTEKFLLAYFSGLSATGRYDIANDLSTKLRSVPSLLLSPLLPAATELEARHDHPRLRELYYRTHKYLIFVGVPIVALVAIIANRFVDLWLGPGFAPAALALQILTAVYMLNLACAPGAIILTGKGILWPAVRSSVLGIVINLVLSTILVIRFGFRGAVYGTSVSLTVATIYFVRLFHAEMQYPIASLLKQGVKPLVCAVLLVIPLRLFFPLTMLRWLGLGIVGGIFILLYCAGLLFTRYFDSFDLQALERFLPLPKIVRRILLFA